MTSAIPSPARRGLIDPLSEALLPILLGLGRKAMLRAGVRAEQRRLAGVNINYYCQPAARRASPNLPVVLIHGIADSAITWLFMLRSLSAVGPVYAIDLPGFGHSGYPAGRRYATITEHVAVVQALIREEIGRPALIVGNSMGGWIAARLALDTPELAAAIALLDPGGAMLAGRPSWDLFVSTVAVPDLHTVRTIYRQMFGRVPLALYLGQLGFRALFLRDAVTQFVAAADEREFFRPEELRSIRVPTALVWGERDSFLPAGSFEFFRDHLPDPAVLKLRGCGHLPQRERPGAVARFIARFARERAAGR